jgi:molecular chaperone HtpG
VFDRNFLDVVPLRSSAGQIEGLAYVLAESVHAGANQLHRVYLKNMLLSAKAHDVLPNWAFFVQCIVNAKDLRPTASRESLYEDGTVHEARRELGQCLRQYLIDLARSEPQRFAHLISVHHLALKALALEDDECLELFSDWFPFETSLGTMSFGEFRKQQPIVRYVSSCDEFRQIAQVAASEALPVINAGYVYDAEVLQRIGALRSDVHVEEMAAAQLSERFEELTLDEREDTMTFERLADATLQQYKCAVDLTKFHPTEMPALYVTNKTAAFLRSVERSREVSDELWTGVLGRLTEDIGSVYARLHFNYLNPLVRRICALADRQAQRRCVEMLYVQSLLLGHFPLKQDEMKLLNRGLLGLIDWALDTRGKRNHD